MKKRLWKRLGALCLLPALLLSGCWMEDAEPETGPLPSMEEELEEESRPILPETFTLPYDPDETLDPVTCADGMQQVVGALLYEGLFELDEALEPQPRLCDGYTYDAASFTYVFTLRSGVTFSDGTALTGNDAAMTLRRAMTSARYQARLSHVVSVAAGDGTVQITLSGPDTGLPALLDIPIVKAGTETSRAPVGTGAYYYTTDGGPCLAANPAWWGGRQPTERIGLSRADTADIMLYQFASHDVHLITADLTGAAPISDSGSVTFREADTTVFQ